MRKTRSWLPQLNRPPAVPAIPSLPRGDGVPRIVHQTFATLELPGILEENVARLLSLNPDYEYRFYDDAAMVAFIAEHYDTRVLKAFQRINPKYGAARADLFRYLVIYRCGGVYIDIKSSFERPMRETILPDDQYLLSKWQNGSTDQFEGWGLYHDLRAIPGGEFQQCHIIAAPGHPFLKAVIENVLRNIDRYNPVLHGVGFIGVLRVTGPIAYTLAITPLLGAHAHRRVDSQAEMGFIYSVYRDDERAHRALYAHHYSRLREPIILTSPIWSPFLAILNGLERLRRGTLIARRAVAKWRRSRGSTL